MRAASFAVRAALGLIATATGSVAVAQSVPEPVRERDYASDNALVVEWIRPTEAVPPARAAAIARLEQRDFDVAAPLLADLVQHGDGWAASQLARLYIHGLGVERDNGRALALLEFAAETGDSRAALAAGIARARGLASPVDPTSARYWLTMAAERGNPFVRRDAMLLLRDLPAAQ